MLALGTIEDVKNETTHSESSPYTLKCCILMLIVVPFSFIVNEGERRDKKKNDNTMEVLK